MSGHPANGRTAIVRARPQAGTGHRRLAPRGPAIAALIAVTAALAFGACGRKIDPNAPFQVTLNGNPYLPGTGEPLASMADVEAGFSSSSRCTVIFPLKALATNPRPGLEIVFNPATIAAGEELPFGEGTETTDIQVAYYPIFGNRPSEGKVLVFSQYEQGTGRIRFDDLGQETGRVAGVLLEAVLYGHYEDMDGQVTKPGKPMEMRVANFPFDVKISDEPW